MVEKDGLNFSVISFLNRYFSLAILLDTHRSGTTTLSYVAIEHAEVTI
jgi:hypothetical protein